MIYRLRNKNLVVGYLRQEDTQSFFSKDLYGWTGNGIEYDFKEISTNFKDKNAQRIFVNDILNFNHKISGLDSIFIVLEKANTIILQGFNSEEEKPLELIQNVNYSVKKIGYLESVDYTK